MSREHEPIPTGVHYAVCGAPGSGKTELIKLLKCFYGFQEVEEPFMQNPHLPKFYQESQLDNAFKTQVTFLAMRGLTRMKILNFLPSDPTSVLEDQGMEGDIIIEHVQRQLGMISPEDHKAYLGVHRSFKASDSLSRPQIIIFLKTNPATIGSRIEKRGREMELSLHKKCPEYFPAVAAAFNRWERVLVRRGFPVVSIDTDNCDFVKRPEHKIQVIEEVLHWTRYYLDSRDPIAASPYVGGGK